MQTNVLHSCVQIEIVLNNIVNIQTNSHRSMIHFYTVICVYPDISLRPKVRIG